MPRPPDQLAQAADVLEYELMMLDSLARGMGSGIAGQSTIHNALVESFAIHTRILISFFYDPKRRATDVVAADFFEDPAAWAQLCPPISATLERARAMASRQVAHFTEERLAVSDEDKSWHFIEVVAELRRVLDAFRASGEHHAVGSKWRPQGSGV